MFETGMSQISHYFTKGNMPELCWNTKIALSTTHTGKQLFVIVMFLTAQAQG